MEEEINNAEYRVIVTNAYKKYPSTPVLSGLSMKVPLGSMYGLLGPSGCGKTTLLKCILGKSSIDSGSIQLSVFKWKDIGFMPQNVSLHTELQVNELFIFYGAIFGLFKDKLEARVNELVDLLELPSLTTLISNCSGGQQRRISLAVTLLHNPELLLLDEPTVGLDPLLAHKIWVYLKTLCTTYRKTIIVTTHYMEEARSLHLIGLMRGGVLLAEKSPLSLIEEYNCSSLDDVFLILSRKQESFTSKSSVKSDSHSKSIKSEPRIENEKGFNVDHLKAQIYKNYKWTLRNIPVTTFILLLPVFSAVMTAIIFKEIKTDMKVGYYSEELFNASCDVNRTVFAKGCVPSPPFSCNYLQILEQNHPTKMYESVEKGLEAIRHGDTFVMIHFPYNFTNAVLQRLSFKTPRKNQTLDESVVDVWFDNTVYSVAFNAQVNIYSALRKLIEQKCTECGINKELAKTPMNFQKLIYGHNNTLCSKIYPHFLNAFLFYTTFIYTSASLLMEKSSGVLERVQMNGMTTTELLTANFIAQFAVLNIQNGLALFAIHGLFMEGYLGSMVLMYAILLLSELFGSIVGLLVLTFSCSTVIVNYFGVGAILTILLSNGMIWPAEAVHWVLKPFTQTIPVNMASESYSHVMLHGFNLTHRLVYPGIIYIILWSLVLILFTTVRIRMNNNQL